MNCYDFVTVEVYEVPTVKKKNKKKKQKLDNDVSNAMNIRMKIYKIEEKKTQQKEKISLKKNHKEKKNTTTLDS